MKILGKLSSNLLYTTYSFSLTYLKVVDKLLENQISFAF